MTTIILVVLLFVLLIFPHELGHFLAAKACNVKVNEFSFGMGPVLISKKGRETLYSVRMIPIGGFCAMEGEDTEDSGENPRAFNNKRWWQKIIILLAGVTMNVLIAFVALSIVCGAQGTIENTLAAVPETGPAYEAGIRPGDSIIMVNDTETSTWYEVTGALQDEMKPGEPVTITVSRNGEKLSFSMIPVESGDRLVIGVEATVVHSFGSAVKGGAAMTGELAGSLLDSIRSIIHSGNVLEEVSGPVGVVQIVSETSSYGIYYYLFLLALISLNLAFFNLLPFPALDGGRIVFVIIRMITGKAISARAEATVHAIGMVLLIALALVVTGSDIMKLIRG
ncbi:MAG: RIP metalloprotease RseP [Firmicutes bacterium]|nr:RIP metalloprotease RseP [Eubacterium sp.]MBR2559553.1 RIP metalloprotease RseP [Bacillota bacterium]MBR3052726.1 RIP metalloprotease RseP [Bacillota bacterium]MBR3212753.1 RIP metalloprotease RseP [Bacillota bacterium]MCR4668725.1 RIP metalloprotease RseP [Clostridia bacterium]